MSPIPKGQDAFEEPVVSRERALRDFSVEVIQNLKGDELLTLQSCLRHGRQLGIWITPDEWLRPAQKKGRAHSEVNLRNRIVNFIPQELLDKAAQVSTNCQESESAFSNLLDYAVLVLTRYLLLLRLSNSSQNKMGGRASLHPRSIMAIAIMQGPILLAQAVTNQIAKPGDLAFDPQVEFRLLNSITAIDLHTISNSPRKEILVECNRIQKFVDMGLWTDAPSFTVTSTAKAMAGPVRSNEEPNERDSHLPLPDEYVAEMGRKSLWLIQVFAPNVLVLLESMLSLWAEIASHAWRPATVKCKRPRGLRKILARHQWRDREGYIFDAPPFPIQLPIKRGFGALTSPKNSITDLHWKPQSYRELMALLGAIQFANYFIVSLSMGSRQSETLSLRRDCLIEGADDYTYANGKTYKLVHRYEGELREWLLPDVAVEAIHLQVKIASLVERIADTKYPHSQIVGDKTPTHLWARISGGFTNDLTQPLYEINRSLIQYARTLLMDEAPSKQNFRSHRFRKTLARLVALALTQAPKLLMDIFGHKSIEMTLYYILTDKDLRAEIETVSRELRVMRAKVVIEKMVDADLSQAAIDEEKLGGYGGLAAVSIRNAVDTQRQRLHRRGSDWGVESAIELAELLTLQGKAWEQVRHGVICTKLPGEAGPCNKSKGRPEPSKCASNCIHRLEEAFLREDVDGAIQDSVVAYEHAIANDDPLTASHWAAQIRAHVLRFVDLKQKWMANTTVYTLMTNRNSTIPT